MSSREVAWSAKNRWCNDLKYPCAGLDCLKPLPSSIENCSPLHLAATGGYTGSVLVGGGKGVSAIWRGGVHDLVSPKSVHIQSMVQSRFYSPGFTLSRSGYCKCGYKLCRLF